MYNFDYDRYFHLSVFEAIDLSDFRARQNMEALACLRPQGCHKILLLKFPDFSRPNSISFSAARLPSSIKRLRIPVSVSVDAASRSQPKESFKSICQNRNFTDFEAIFPDFTDQLFFFTDFFLTFLTCDIPVSYFHRLWVSVCNLVPSVIQLNV